MKIGLIDVAAKEKLKGSSEIPEPIGGRGHYYDGNASAGYYHHTSQRKRRKMARRRG